MSYKPNLTSQKKVSEIALQDEEIKTLNAKAEN